MDFNKGDILDGKKTFYPFVFLRMLNGETFEGCMLTHKKPKKGYDNIELKEEHFEKENERGEK